MIQLDPRTGVSTRLLDVVALPDDPSTPLTPEQLRSVFGGDVESGLKVMLALSLVRREPVAPVAPEVD